MKDTDPMPFGVHKDKPMSDVPVGYLHWFWTKGDANSEKAIAVKTYISDNLDALKMENPDLIWG